MDQIVDLPMLVRRDVLTYPHAFNRGSALRKHCWRDPADAQAHGLNLEETANTEDLHDLFDGHANDKHGAPIAPQMAFAFQPAERLADRSAGQTQPLGD